MGIEFHMVDDSINLDIVSRNYYCITVTWLLRMGIRIFHVPGLFGVVGIIFIGTGSRPLLYSYINKTKVSLAISTNLILLIVLCSISCLIEDETYWCLDVHLLLYDECLCNCCIYKYVCLYTVVVLPISMYKDFLLVRNYSMVDMLVLHIWILCKTLYMVLTIWLY